MKTQFDDKYSHIILLIALGLSIVACFLLIQPYLEPVFIAFILALIFHPLHHWIEQRIGRRPNLTALISCTLLTFVIVLPLVLIFLAILRQGAIYSTSLYDWVDGGGPQALLKDPWLTENIERLENWLPEGFLDPAKLIEQTLGMASGLGKDVVNLGARLAGGITSLAVSLFLMLFVLFFALRDHDRIITFLRHALPLSRSQEDALLGRIMDVSKSALLGSLLTAVTQGVVGGIGLWLAGFPGLFWGTVMAFASLIPVVGTALVWLPAALYLMVTGDGWGWGVFLIAWGVLAVGSVDNFLRPLFMQGSSSMNTVSIFFALLGGIHLFGLMGLLYGPIVFAVTVVLFRIYEREFAEFLEYQDRR
jgi:predicted PurR-regulated permease PerM